MVKVRETSREGNAERHCRKGWTELNGGGVQRRTEKAGRREGNEGPAGDRPAQDGTRQTGGKGRTDRRWNDKDQGAEPQLV